MRPPLALVLLALPAAGQASLVRSDGVLGSSIDYDLGGDPGEVFALIPSLSAGPTPLALVDPLDPRSLAVGIDLAPLWTIGVLAGGAASVSFPVSADPTLHGVPFHAQFITVPGSPTLADDLSNPTSFRLGLPGESTFTISDRPAPVDGHTATTLADGRVLLAGGVELLTPTSGVALDGFELFDPQTQTFAPTTGGMQHGRSAHTATPLADGRVLLLGGEDDTGTVTATGDVWDPATGLATPIAPMSTPRVTHTATLLPDGRVFVAGGISFIDPDDQFSVLLNTLASTEVYDPATDQWSPGPALPQKLTGHAAAPTGDGRVLISGGIEVTVLFGLPVPTVTTACRRYDPSTNSFVATQGFSPERSLHAMIPLADGRALSVGGNRIVGLSNVTMANVASYDPSTNQWTPHAPLTVARSAPQVLDTGSAIVVIGGVAAIDAQGNATEAVAIEVAPRTLASFASPSSMLLPRLSATSAVVDGGERVLTTGVGDDGMPSLDTTAEVFVP